MCIEYFDLCKKCAKCQLQKFSIFPSLNYLNCAENQNDMIYRFSMNLQNLYNLQNGKTSLQNGKTSLQKWQN